LFIKKMLLCGIYLSAVLSLGVDFGQAQEKKLFIFNFANYFAEDTITNFSQKTGIDVQLDYFDTAEMMEARLVVGKSGYDVAFSNSPSGSRLIDAGGLQKIDRTKLKNYANLVPSYLELLKKFDPDNDYLVPYMMATTGIAYNVEIVEKIYGENSESWPVSSLDIFFRPEIVSQFAECGIAINDSPSEILPIVLNYLGLDPYSSSQADLEKARQLLFSLRPHIRHMNTGQIIDDLAAGEICLALTWDGDANIARAQGAEHSVRIAYELPREGTTIAFDSMVIPADSSNVEAAHAFIDYLLEAKVIAAISDEVFFPNPNAKSLEFLSGKMVDDMEILSREAEAGKLFLEKNIGMQEMQERERMWANFRIGE